MIFCPLFSGSSGNASVVSTKNSTLLIDAGGTGKLIEESLKKIEIDPKKIDGILITHEHSDHIKGAGVMSRKYDIPIYASSGTWDKMKNVIGKISDKNIEFINCDIEFNDILMKSFPTPHDCNESIGFTFTSSGVKICSVTDIGHITNEIKNEMTNSNIILIESNHDEEMVKFGPYPYYLKKRILGLEGHLSNTDCGNAIVNTFNGEKKEVVLGHLSNTNNVPELAYETVVNIINENKIKLNKEIVINIAKRYEPSCYIELF